MTKGTHECVLRAWNIFEAVQHSSFIIKHYLNCFFNMSVSGLENACQVCLAFATTTSLKLRGTPDKLEPEFLVALGKKKKLLTHCHCIILGE